LRQHPGQQRPTPQAAHVRDRRHERGPCAPFGARQVHQPRGCRTREDAGREPREDAACEQESKTVGDQECDRAERGQGEARQQHPPTADLVGKAAEQQQRGDHPRCVRREDHCDDQLGDPEALAIQAVQRSGQRRAEHGDREREPGRRQANPGRRTTRASAETTDRHGQRVSR
jgi:hypothetical protein